MKLITDISTLPVGTLAPSVATIGFFDGVHRGHRFLIDQVCSIAQERSLSTLLVTFSQHPRMVMQKDYQPRLLSSFDEKCNLLSCTGVETCVALPFTRELAVLSARDFMQQILHDHLQVRVLVIGYDHRFGHNRTEGFEDYVRYASELGMEVIRADAYQLSDIHISSSVIRSFLEAGEIELYTFRPCHQWAADRTHTRISHSQSSAKRQAETDSCRWSICRACTFGRYGI